MESERTYPLVRRRVGASSPGLGAGWSSRFRASRGGKTSGAARYFNAGANPQLPPLARPTTKDCDAAPG